MKRILKAVISSLGYELKRKRPVPAPATSERPIARLSPFFEDMRARGFMPRGILDVGANRGHWTREAWGTFPGVPSLMIEPQAELRAQLEDTAAMAPGSRVVIAGAGRAPGELVQTIWEDSLGSSFLPPSDANEIAAGRQRKVPIVTINQVLAESPAFHPDLAKLDVEGFELEALAGGDTLFARAELIILETVLFEFLPQRPITRQIIDYMAEREFELYDVVDGLRRPLDGALGTLDLAFARREGRFRSDRRWHAGQET